MKYRYGVITGRCYGTSYLIDSGRAGCTGAPTISCGPLIIG